LADKITRFISVLLETPGDLLRQSLRTHNLSQIFGSIALIGIWQTYNATYNGCYVYAYEGADRL